MRHGHLDWSGWLASPALAARDTTAGDGNRRRRILVATSTGGLLHAADTESLLAVSLTMRGAAVDVLLCDGALPACHLCNFPVDPSPSRLIVRGPAACRDCYEPARRLFEDVNLTIRRYSEYLTADHILAAKRLAVGTSPDRLASVEYEGLRLGEQALAGALRYFRVGRLPEGPDGEAVLRRYLEAAARAAFAVGALLEAEPYDCAVFHHGLYVPQGVIGEVCRAKGVRVVNWNPAYRSSRFLFSHDDTYHRTMTAEPVSVWRDLALSPTHREALHAYLRSRWTGREDWISFHPAPHFDVAEFFRTNGLDDRPTLGLLTSVMWDARLHYPSNAFPDMLAWIEHTIRHVAARTNLQLVIRIHPAEAYGTSPAVQRVGDEIARRFPSLPSNIVVVQPDDCVSTYALMERCDTVLIYNTKAGMEMSATGIPVVVAGEAWIRGKGFSTDVSSPQEYEKVLSELPTGRRLDPERHTLAERYAYHFFFRRMIPVPLMRATGRIRGYARAFDSPQDLEVGRHRGLDVICDGILRGTDFVYPAEIDSEERPMALPGLSTTPVRLPFAIEIQRRRKTGKIGDEAFAAASAEILRRYDQHDLSIGAESRKRHAADARHLDAQQEEIVRSLRRDGIVVVPLHRLFGEEALARVVAAVREFEARSLREIARNSRVDARLLRFARRIVRGRPAVAKAEMRRAIRSGKSLSLADPWLQLAVSPAVLDIANAYLGTWTKVSYLDQWHTPPSGDGRQRTGSQLWHRDYNDRRLLKVFVYMSDVDAGSGMFEYVAGTMRTPDGSKNDAWNPFADSRLSQDRQAALDRDPAAYDIRSVVGPVGTVILCDTSGLHRGGFARQRARTLGTWTYVSPASLECVAPRNFTIASAELPADTPPQVRFALM